MQRFIKLYALWLAYAGFIALASMFGAREGFLTSPTLLAPAKYLFLLIYLLFLGFSIYATRKENFFRSLRTMNGMLWGRQVGIDLYISVFLSLTLIYLIEVSVIVVLLWALPVLLFANLAILPYILLNFSEILTHLLI